MSDTKTGFEKSSAEDAATIVAQHRKIEALERSHAELRGALERVKKTHEGWAEKLPVLRAAISLVAEQIDAALASQGPRCTVTGNPCGTDTVSKGDTCPGNDGRCVYASQGNTEPVPFGRRQACEHGYALADSCPVCEGNTEPGRETPLHVLQATAAERMHRGINSFMVDGVSWVRQTEITERGGRTWTDWEPESSATNPPADGQYLCETDLVYVLLWWEAGGWSGDLRGTAEDPERVLRWMPIPPSAENQTGSGQK